MTGAVNKCLPVLIIRLESLRQLHPIHTTLLPRILQLHRPQPIKNSLDSTILQSRVSTYNLQSTMRPTSETCWERILANVRRYSCICITCENYYHQFTGHWAVVMLHSSHHGTTFRGAWTRGIIEGSLVHFRHDWIAYVHIWE